MLVRCSFFFQSVTALDSYPNQAPISILTVRSSQRSIHFTVVLHPPPDAVPSFILLLPVRQLFLLLFVRTFNLEIPAIIRGQARDPGTGLIRVIWSFSLVSRKIISDVRKSYLHIMLGFQQSLVLLTDLFPGV